jgi:hypothetical protein
VVIDVDQELAVGNAWGDGTQALEAGRVGSDYAIEFKTCLGFLEEMIRIEKLLLLRIAVFIPADDFFALVLQG